MKKRKKKYFQRVDYIFRHNALTKFLSKKAWYNFYSPLSIQRNYKWIYFLAFFDLAFLIMNRLGLQFKVTEDNVFIWIFFSAFIVSGIVPALMFLYSSIKALVVNK